MHIITIEIYIYDFCRGENMNDKELYHDLLEKIEFRNTLNASGISNIKDLALELQHSFFEFGIGSFFKYSSFNKKYTKDILENDIFHLSPLDKMNDPAEFSYKEMNSLKKRKQPQFDISNLETAAQKELFAYFNNEMYDEAYNLLKKNTLICSLTTDCLEATMWAHYADNYKGICIEYDSLELFNNTAGKLGPIIYREEALDIDATDYISFLKSIRKVSFSKKNSLSYENEWRVSKTVIDKNYSHLSEDEKLMVENDTNYSFKPKSLTIGYDMDLESKNELYDLCKNNGIKVYDLQQGTEGYKLKRIEHSS